MAARYVAGINDSSVRHVRTRCRKLAPKSDVSYAPSLPLLSRPILKPESCPSFTYLDAATF